MWKRERAWHKVLRRMRHQTLIMKEFGTYQCLLTKDQLTGQVTCSIGHDSLEFNNDQGRIILDFADLIDFRLPGYRILLTTTSGEVVLSQLGHDTEAFFEKLWSSYMERSMVR